MALKSIEEYEKELAEVMRKLGNAKKIVATHHDVMFFATRDKFIMDMENEAFRLRSLLNVMRKDKALKDQAEALRNAGAKDLESGMLAQTSGKKTETDAQPRQSECKSDHKSVNPASNVENSEVV
jgi:hypothetical protein